MSKYTPLPGPWKWYWRKEDGEANCGVFAEPREGHAYAICRAPRYETKEQWEANARLIAAAPDLLAALRAWAMAANGDGIDKRNLITLVKMTESAIAKATQP